MCNVRTSLLSYLIIMNPLIGHFGLGTLGTACVKSLCAWHSTTSSSFNAPLVQNLTLFGPDSVPLHEQSIGRNSTVIY